MKRTSNIRNNHRNSRSKRFNKYVLVCGFIAIFLIILAATTIFVQAREHSNISYTSIEIQENDTLWGIATAYCDTETESINDYIDHLKQINNLGSDNITSGNYIIVYEYK